MIDEHYKVIQNIIQFSRQSQTEVLPEKFTGSEVTATVLDGPSAGVDDCWPTA